MINWENGGLYYGILPDSYKLRFDLFCAKEASLLISDDDACAIARDIVLGLERFLVDGTMPSHSPYSEAKALIGRDRLYAYDEMLLNVALFLSIKPFNERHYDHLDTHPIETLHRSKAAELLLDSCFYGPHHGDDLEPAVSAMKDKIVAQLVELYKESLPQEYKDGWLVQNLL